MSSFSCCCRFSIFSNPESQKQDYYWSSSFFFYKISKNISECTGVIISDYWSSFRIQPVEIWRNHDNPFLRCMHYLRTLQWSQQLCWLPPQPWWGCFLVHQEPPGPPESLSLTAGCRRAGSRFVALSTPPADYSKITNEMKGKWLWIPRFIANGSNLIFSSTYCQVADGPCSFLLCSKITLFRKTKIHVLDFKFKVNHCLVRGVSKLDSSKNQDSGFKFYFRCRTTDY